LRINYLSERYQYTLSEQLQSFEMFNNKVKSSLKSMGFSIVKNL
jgi:hypothetical protein